MSYISIENYKYGLDNRKSVLTSNPGALVKLQDAHVNEGGEIETRKAYSLFVADAVVDANADHSFFGLEASSFGLLTFTHDTASSAPAGLTKRVLKHPEVYDGGTYARAKHRITSVPCSQPFKGNVIVFATFADGNTFGYYCQSTDVASVATPIDHFRNGMRFGTTVIKTDIKRILNALTGWTAADADTSEIAFDQIVSLKSPVSITFNAVATVVTTGTGLMAFSAISSSGSIGTQLVRAYASFNVTAVANGATILAVSFAGVNLGKVTLTGADTTTTAAVAIALSINKLTGLTGYSAVTNATNGVFIFAPLSTDPGAVTITAAGGATVGALGGTPTFFATASSYAVTKTMPRTNGGPFGNNVNVVSPSVTAYPNGGTSPYTYLWTEVSGASGITITSPTLNTTTFSKILDNGQSASGSFRCTIQDSAGPPKASAYFDIQVTLIHSN